MKGELRLKQQHNCCQRHDKDPVGMLSVRDLYS